MTLSAWIRPTAAQGGWRTILQRQTDAYFLSASNGDPLHPAGGGTFGGNIEFVGGPTANPLNTWTHVALSYDLATLRLYVNGTQVATHAATGSIQTNTNPLWMGGNTPYGEYFQGLIDEVRVYNRALNQAEIQTDMNTPVSPAAPDTTPPTAPSGLSATAASSTQINLGWTASTDNVGVSGYRVERCQGAGCTNFAQVATPAGTSHNDTGLSPSTTYRYRVRAADAAGNLSAVLEHRDGDDAGRCGHDAPDGAVGADARRRRARPRSTSAGRPRPTTSASAAIGSSAARARAARTSPRSRPRPAPPTTTPASRPRPPTATRCARPMPPAT